MIDIDKYYIKIQLVICYIIKFTPNPKRNLLSPFSDGKMMRDCTKERLPPSAIQGHTAVHGLR